MQLLAMSEILENVRYEDVVIVHLINTAYIFGIDCILVIRSNIPSK